jgi:hypothetical protein
LPDILAAYNDQSQEPLDDQQQDSLSWYVYVISGYCDSPLANVERLPIEHSQYVSGFENQKVQNWQECASLSIARTKFQAVVVPFSLEAGKPLKQTSFILGGKNS